MPRKSKSFRFLNVGGTFDFLTTNVGCVVLERDRNLSELFSALSNSKMGLGLCQLNLTRLRVKV